MSDATFLPTYLETLDRSPLEVLPMLAPGFAFSVLWDDEHGAKEWNGGLDEFHGYLAQREPEGYAHHVHSASRDGTLEVVLGKTTRHGALVATFTMAAQLDEQGRAQKLFAARTTALPLDWPR
jgi:hypothetical protein